MDEESKRNARQASELTAANRSLERELAEARLALKSIAPTVDGLKQRDAQLSEHVRDLGRQRDALLAERSRHLSDIDELEMLRGRMCRQRDNALDRVKALQAHAGM